MCLWSQHRAAGAAKTGRIDDIWQAMSHLPTIWGSNTSKADTFLGIENINGRILPQSNWEIFHAICSQGSKVSGQTGVALVAPSSARSFRTRGLGGWVVVPQDLFGEAMALHPRHLVCICMNKDPAVLLSTVTSAADPVNQKYTDSEPGTGAGKTAGFRGCSMCPVNQGRNLSCPRTKDLPFKHGVMPQGQQCLDGVRLRSAQGHFEVETSWINWNLRHKS